MMADQPELKLKQFAFEALFTDGGLAELDAAFLDALSKTDALLANQLQAYRSGESWEPKALSEFIITCAPILEAFIAELFQIEDQVAALQEAALQDNPIFQFKKYYVQMHAKRMRDKLNDLSDFDNLNQWVFDKAATINAKDPELAMAKLGMRFLDDPEKNQANIDQLIAWCVLVQKIEAGQNIIKNWQSFHLPKKMQFENLVQIEPLPDDPFARFEGPKSTQRNRDGFTLTDPRMNTREIQSEIHYCVYCHRNDGDFCSKGFPVKKNKPELGLKINPMGDTLTGCPLEEKISEMQFLKRDGYSIAALATIMIDNPMCAATGHRICNDCMQACIYQKQDPVNIPQVETGILTDVLGLPWGVEIYDLLMRWNPLRQTQFLPKAYNNTKVLIMGMGPAGFTLAHHLLMEGCAVVGADGLKIEPLDSEQLTKPIYSFASLKESLDNRVVSGFGGVAEYGITVRWDKNFLKLIYISLARRALFQVFGNVRFGGAITVEKAWQLGFDHVAIAVGAGLPRELAIPNSLAPGMRQANDFLMALQLTGAAKLASLANLQVQLPAVVIGGGLTGIDTATEVQAYYIVQVEKVHQRYEILKNHFGEKALRACFDVQSLAILDEYLAHAKAVLAERQTAKTENRLPDFKRLIHQWGGVTIAYRKSMQESPAYKRNFDEITKALEEGIYYAQGLEPKSVVLDEYGAASALVCRWRIQDEEGEWMFSTEEQTLPAKSIFVATGAKPNVAYEFEHRGTFVRHGMDYRRFTLNDDRPEAVHENGHIKTKNLGVFTSYDKHDKNRVSFIGDTHPIFHGSVVKAIASAKLSYTDIMQSLKHKMSVGDLSAYQHFRQKMTSLFQAHVISVVRQSDHVVEITVKAPLLADCFSAGQFYRIQNFERSAKRIDNTQLQTEAISALGIQNPDHPDQLSFVIVETGASARLVATFEVGQPIAIMGPTGAKTHIPTTPQDILIVGDNMAIIYLLSVGPALKAAGHRIFCVIATDAPFCQSRVDDLVEDIKWCSSETAIPSVLANLPKIPLADIQSITVIGTPSILRSMQSARNTLLDNKLHNKVKFTASVYGPMQCMLKGVCAQCLQWQIDPVTGKRTKAVYACSWQHQPMEIIDIDNINERLVQNKMQETLTNLWLDYLFDQYSIARV